MKPGQTVEVQEAFDCKAFKRVVSVDDRNVYVCSDEEYRCSIEENREPICIGFPRQFVLGVVNESGQGSIRQLAASHDEHAA
jgi:hypothetical protein